MRSKYRIRPQNSAWGYWWKIERRFLCFWLQVQGYMDLQLAKQTLKILEEQE